jgi:hypothetical protein
VGESNKVKRYKAWVLASGRNMELNPDSEVVEASAFDALQAERDGLLEALKLARGGGVHKMDFGLLQSQLSHLTQQRDGYREALGLVCDLASQTWQSASGVRHSTFDNSGKRFWFIADEVMQDARAALKDTP